MVWASKETKYLADIDLQFNNGREFGKTIPYMPGEHFNELTFKFIPDTKRITIVPYKLEALINPVGKVYGENRLNAFMAGIRNDSHIQFIDISWEPVNGGFKRVEQYFFRGDLPSGYASANYSGDSWPSAKPRIIDAETRHYFEELETFRPKASESIENCVMLLE
jgi:hypothetical protein